MMDNLKGSQSKFLGELSHADACLTQRATVHLNGPSRGNTPDDEGACCVRSNVALNRRMNYG